MIKLYKRTEEGLFYHEAWVSGMQIIEHKGKVGTNGEAYSFDYTSGQPDELSLERTLKAARQEGFEPIPEEAHHELNLTWNYASKPADIETIADELEEVINEVLGWQGLGQVHQKIIANQATEMTCLVVDQAISINRISEVLLEPRYQGFQFC